MKTLIGQPFQFLVICTNFSSYVPIHQTDELGSEPVYYEGTECMYF